MPYCPGHIFSANISEARRHITLAILQASISAALCQISFLSPGPRVYFHQSLLIGHVWVPFFVGRAPQRKRVSRPCDLSRARGATAGIFRRRVFEMAAVCACGPDRFLVEHVEDHQECLPHTASTLPRNLATWLSFFIHQCHHLSVAVTESKGVADPLT